MADDAVYVTVHAPGRHANPKVVADGRLITMDWGQRARAFRIPLTVDVDPEPAGVSVCNGVVDVVLRRVPSA